MVSALIYAANSGIRGATMYAIASFVTAPQRVHALNHTYAPNPVPDKNLTKKRSTVRYPFTVSIIQTNDKKTFFLYIKGGAI